MRIAIPLTVATALLVVFAGFSFLGKKDPCEVFGDDVNLAVTDPTKAPDPDDHGSLQYGSCSYIATKKFDVHVLGWNRHSVHTVAGRIYVGGGDRGELHADKVALKHERGVRVTALPKLGPGAFLVTRTQPASQESQAFGGLPDPAAALPLPATVYWASVRYGSYSVSATRDGATVEQAQRATERLAELVNRRTVKQAN